MNLYTVVYFHDEPPNKYNSKWVSSVNVCRVWANDLDSVIRRCNNTLGRVNFVLEGHPEILSHTGKQIPTYDWGNPK